MMAALSPEVLERPCTELRVAGGVFDVGMTQPELEPPGIVTRVRQQVAAGVPQHVRVAVG